MTNDFECYRDIIPEFSLFQESLQRPLPTYIRVNTLKAEPNQLVETLKGKGVQLEKASEKIDTLYLAPDLQSPGNLLEYFLGYIHPQTLSSGLAALALSPRENSFVLDMCAAPGGKSTHLAQLMKNTGLIIANELYRSRLNPLGATLARLGVVNTIVTSYQAQEFPLKQRFDFILADVPCSGEGRVRRVNKRSTHRKIENRRKLFDLQKKIILRGFDLLTETGEMLYATCTYNPEENESVVDFLLKNRDARLLALEDDLGHEPGLSGWKEQHYDSQMRKAGRFYPHRIDSVGFFMARIGKR